MWYPVFKFWKNSPKTFPTEAQQSTVGGTDMLFRNMDEIMEQMFHNMRRVSQRTQLISDKLD